MYLNLPTYLIYYINKLRVAEKKHSKNLLSYYTYESLKLFYISEFVQKITFL